MWGFLKKRSWIILLLLIVLLFPQSLSIQAKLNMKTLISALAIDKVGGQYEVTAQIINPMNGKSSNEGNSKASFVTDKGDTIAQAVEKIGFIIGKTTGLGHVNFILLGDELMKENIAGQLDYFVRDKRTSNSILVLACAGSAKDELKKTSSLEASTGIGLQKVFIYKQQSTNGYVTPIIEIANSVYTKSKSCVVNMLEIEESAGSTDSGGGSQSGGESSGNATFSGGESSASNEDSKIKYLSPLVCFVAGEKVGTLEEESEIFGFLVATKHTGRGSLDIGKIQFDGEVGENVNIRYSGKKARKKVVFENGNPVLEIKININDANVRSVNTSNMPSINFYKETSDEFEKSIIENMTKTIQSNIEMAFEKGKQMGCDLFNIADIAYRTQYNKWSENIKDNPEYLNNAELRVFVSIKKIS